MAGTRGCRAWWWLEQAKRASPAVCPELRVSPAQRCAGQPAVKGRPPHLEVQVRQPEVPDHLHPFKRDSPAGRSPVSTHSVGPCVGARKPPVAPSRVEVQGVDTLSSKSREEGLSRATSQPGPRVVETTVTKKASPAWPCFPLRPSLLGLGTSGQAQLARTAGVGQASAREQ